MSRGGGPSSRGAPSSGKSSSGTRKNDSGAMRSSGNTIRTSSGSSKSREAGPSKSTALNSHISGEKGEARSENPGTYSPAEASPAFQINASDIINYRGSRVLYNGGDFALQNVKTRREGNEKVTVELTFNQSLNPLSVNTSSILLNGQAVSSETKFSFNKKGDTIRMDLPVELENVSITVQNVESFDGTPLAPVEIKNLNDIYGEGNE